MKKKIIILLLLVSCPLMALEETIRKLATEFLEKNIQVYRERERVLQREWDLDKKLQDNRWTLTGYSNRENNSLARGPLSSSLDEKTTSHGMDLKRTFSFGGDLTFTNELNKMSYNIQTGYPTAYDFSQSIAYGQDLGANFLGRKFSNELAELKTMVEYQKALKDDNIQRELYLFVREYENLRLNETLLHLQREARDRAERRVAFVREQVGNGLKERVDLYQSRMALLSAEEEVRILGANAASGLKGLSQKLQRNLTGEELTLLPLDQKEIPPPPSGGIEQNFSLEANRLNENIQKISLRQSEYDLFPKINFQIGYTTNDRDQQKKEVFRQGLLSSGTNSNALKAMLSLEMPLSFTSERIEIAQASSRLNIAKAQVSFRKKELEREEEKTLIQLTAVKEKILSARRRQNLARQSLAEYSAFYRRGRASLDQVIRAEEDLINTQKSLAQYIFLRTDLHLLLAVLHGNLETYLFETK